MSKSNEYWNGSNGRIWVNDSAFDRVKSFEVKMALNWEDVPSGLSTERVLMSHSYEGSFAYRKTDKNYNNAIDMLFDDYRKGVVPDVYIVSKAFNGATGKTQRVKITGITFDELTLQKWEEQSLAEEELSFKASKVEIL